MKFSSTCFFLLLLSLSWSRMIQADVITVNFEDKTFYTPGSGGTFYNGKTDGGAGVFGTPNSNGWSSGTVAFGNAYQVDTVFDYEYWGGFAYSNVQDSTTEGFGNQYAAFTGSGFGGSGNYAVGYDGSLAYFNLPTNYVAQSVYLTNTTYTGLAVENGYFAARSFIDGDYLDVRQVV
jgi:hypothetical protein